MPYGINSQKIQGGTFNDIGRDQTNNTYRGQVVGHHVQIESMTVGCSHAGQALVKRTMYDEFRQVLLGDVIALQNIHHEDLSRYEWQVRGGKFLGRLKARATTQTVQLFPHGGTQFTVIKYDGADAEKAWKRDFEMFSETREPGSPQLFAINLSKIPMLIFHHTEHTPVTSMQVKDLDHLLYCLSFTFDNAIKKYSSILYDTVNFNFGWLSQLVNEDNLPDGMQGLVEGLYLSQRRLDYASSPKEWDQVLQQLLHILHVWGCEIDSEAGKKDYGRWVMVKDSGSIQELDDDNEDRPDMHSWATYSSEESSDADSYTSEDEDEEYEEDWVSSHVDSYIPEDDTEDDEVILYPRSN
ncbi:hypothetical protein VNI00_016048 [Paramarasmius palmivorus]|uniref:Uncharacterized protein n=1 Tax=Paramarasmius palmivorus TaxID=297713 RepID=A0AAW0BHS5_9AGAR